MHIAQNKNSKRRLSFDLSKEDVEKAIESLTVSNPVNRRMAHKFTLVLSIVDPRSKYLTQIGHMGGQKNGNLQSHCCQKTSCTHH
jgi:hypothetical protein